MNAHRPPVEARKSGEWSKDFPETITSALDRYDFYKTSAFEGLSELASLVEIEGYVVDANSTVIDGETWVTPGTIYVKLTYDPNSEDPVVLDDSYPITVKLRLKNGAFEIEDVDADVSSFYE